MFKYLYHAVHELGASTFGTSLVTLLLMSLRTTWVVLTASRWLEKSLQDLKLVARAYHMLRNNQALGVDPVAHLFKKLDQDR
jgi:hypothetical protein